MMHLMNQELVRGAAVLWVLAGRAAEGSTVHASTDHFSVICPDGAHQVGLAEPHKQPAVRGLYVPVQAS